MSFAGIIITGVLMMIVLAAGSVAINVLFLKKKTSMRKITRGSTPSISFHPEFVMPDWKPRVY